MPSCCGAPLSMCEDIFLIDTTCHSNEDDALSDTKEIKNGPPRNRPRKLKKPNNFREDDRVIRKKDNTQKSSPLKLILRGRANTTESNTRRRFSSSSHYIE